MRFNFVLVCRLLDKMQCHCSVSKLVWLILIIMRQLRCIDYRVRNERGHCPSLVRYSLNLNIMPTESSNEVSRWALDSFLLRYFEPFSLHALFFISTRQLNSTSKSFILLIRRLVHVIPKHINLFDSVLIVTAAKNKSNACDAVRLFISFAQHVARVNELFSQQ